VYGVRICKDGLYVCVVRIKNEKDIVDIMEIVYNHAFFARCVMCKVSINCKKISDNVPEDGALIANLSFWIIILFLLVK